MKSNKRKHLTEAEFKQIKQLQDAGLSVNLTAKIVGRSVGAVAGVFKADSLKDHRAKQAAARRKYLSPVQPREDFKEGTFPQAPRPAEDNSLIMTKLTNIENCLNTLLDVIQDKEAKANSSFWRR